MAFNNRGNSKADMRSIKIRLVRNFMLVIVVSMVVLEFLLISFVKHYYYNNVDEILTNQIKIASDFYNRYFSNASLEDNIIDNIDVFWKQTSAEVQIVDTSGKVLMDSIGIIPEKNINTIDFKRALNGEKGRWIGNVNYEESNVMAVAYPLKSDTNTVGVLRFITSLGEVNQSIQNISFVFISIGVVVILIAGIVSIFLAHSIIEPIKEVTGVAEKMAEGNLTVRSSKKFNDEIGKLSDTLNYMAEEIIKKDQLKNDFISSVSHELRTPLTAIKGWAIILNNKQLKDENTISEGLKIIEKESERLTLMVEELLDFSKFVSGKITLNKEQIDIIEIIEYIKKYLSPRAERDKLKFNVEYSEDIPLVCVDKNRIKQVLINILDNAFKFTSKGGEVNLNAYIEGPYVIMLIRDTGCGIGENDLPRVKEKFYKGKSSKSQNGIGLSICDEIIKLHKGELNIESEVNVGTRVYIKLPI